jgi:dTMP kinase
MASQTNQRKKTAREKLAHPEVAIPKHTRKSFYGYGVPGVNLDELGGKLIVVEGADGSGRSTQINRLVKWLEASGHATVQVGLKRSTLVSEELAAAQEGNILSRTTLSLFYATDFADQLVNVIIPSLRAGFIVLADRYIYTLMARDLARGVDMDWLRNLYGIAIVPDAVIYLKVSPQTLVQRNFAKNPELDYWESGMDLGLSRDMFDSFLRYQSLLIDQFRTLQKIYGFRIVNADRPVDPIQNLLRKKIETVLNRG